MGNIYRVSLGDVQETTEVIQNISVGSRSLTFTFRWASASAEQYDIIMTYLNTLTSADPLIEGETYVRDYNYIDYYGPLIGLSTEQLSAWLDKDPILPKSIKFINRNSQLVLLQERISRAEALEPVLSQYKEVMRWQFRMVYNNDDTVGVVEPGGWYRNQDEEFSFRFISDLDYISKDDLHNVSIEFEVYRD